MREAKGYEMSIDLALTLVSLPLSSTQTHTHNALPVSTEFADNTLSFEPSLKVSQKEQAAVRFVRSFVYMLVDTSSLKVCSIPSIQLQIVRSLCLLRNSLPTTLSTRLLTDCCI